MKPLYLLALILLPLGLIIAFVPASIVKPFKVDQAQLIVELKTKAYYKTSDEIADMIIKKDPSLLLVDVRDVQAFNAFALPNAIHIPLEKVVDKEYVETLNQDVYTVVFYSNGNVDAVEAWMLCRQLGYENIYVLQGGLNHWYETVLHPTAPATTMPDEELAKYNFRKAAGSALGADSAAATAIVPVTKSATPVSSTPKKKKKGASGGCG